MTQSKPLYSIFTVLLTLVFVVVVGVLRDPHAQAADPKRIILLIAAIVITSSMLITKAPKHERPLGAAPTLWIFFVLGSGCSLLWGRSNGVNDLAFWVGASGLLFATRSLPIDFAQSFTVFVAYIIGTLNALWAVVQTHMFRGGAWAHGFQGNPNWLGLLLACTIVLSYTYVRSAHRTSRLLRTFTRIGLLIQGYAMYLSHSRVAWCALAIAISIALFSQAKASKFRIILWIIGLILSLCFITLSLNHLLPSQRTHHEANLNERTEQTENVSHEASATQSFQGRIWLTRVSLNARFLPFGAGLGNFGHVYLESQGKELSKLDLRKASQKFINATTAHNDGVQVLVESGPIVFFFFVASLIVAWRVSLHQWLTGNAAITALIVCAFGDSPFRQPSIVALWTLILGSVHVSSTQNHFIHSHVTSSVLEETTNEKAHPKDIKAFAQRTTLLAIWFSAAFCLPSAIATWRGSRALSHARTLVPPMYENALVQATRIDSRSGESYLLLGLSLLEQEEALNALVYLQKSEQLLANVGTHIAIANAHMMLGEVTLAIEAYQHALRLHPGMFRAHFNIAVAYHSAHELSRAHQHLKLARMLQPGHPKLGELEQQLKSNQPLPSSFSE